MRVVELEDLQGARENVGEYVRKRRCCTAVATDGWRKRRETSAHMQTAGERPPLPSPRPSLLMIFFLLRAGAEPLGAPLLASARREGAGRRLLPRGRRDGVELRQSRELASWRTAGGRQEHWRPRAAHGDACAAGAGREEAADRGRRGHGKRRGGRGGRGEGEERERRERRGRGERGEGEEREGRERRERGGIEGWELRKWQVSKWDVETGAEELRLQVRAELSPCKALSGRKEQEGEGRGRREKGPGRGSEGKR
eukprot:766120-Hanusia_phi.AAC.4